MLKEEDMLHLLTRLLQNIILYIYFVKLNFNKYSQLIIIKILNK